MDENGNRIRQTFDSSGNLIRRQDARGNQTHYVFNSSNNLTSLTDELGHTTRYEYDSQGRITAQIDSAGYRTQYQVNNQGMITSVTTSMGDRRAYEYSTAGHLTRSIDELGRSREFSYDINGNLMSATIGSGSDAQITRYTYDKQGRQTSVTDAMGARISTSYDAAGNIASRTDALGHVVTYHYDAMNQLIRVEYPADSVNQAERPTRRWVRNALGFVVQMIDEIGATTDFEVDSLGRVLREQKPIRSDGERSTVVRTYYPDGKVQSETDAMGGITRYNYDAAGNLVSSLDPLGFERQYSFDAANRMIEQVDPLGQKIAYAYDPRGLLVTQTFDSSTVYRFQYDHRGLKIAQTDPLNRTTYYQYNAVGDLVRVEDALGGIQSYAYNQHGQMIEVVDPNGARSQADYDASGRLVSVTLPMGQSRLYEYDLNGNLIAQTDFEGQRTEFQFDSRGRMIKQTNSTGQSFQLTYNDRGERIKEVSELGEATSTFSPDGHLLSRTDVFGNTVQYQYDLAGRKTQVRSPAHTTNRQYDLLGRVTLVSADGVANTTLRTSYTYDALGRALSIENSNGILENNTYDRFGRVASTRWTNAGQTLDQLWYQYDAVGNRTRVLELDGSETLYRYDGLNRLVGERLTSQGVLVHELTYHFDAASHRTRIDGLAGGAVEFGYDANGRLLTRRQAGVIAEQRLYDANGNLTEKRSGPDVTQYTWDSLGQLIAIDQGAGQAGMRFQYDVDGLRIESVDPQGTKRFVWDTTEVNGALLAEQTTAGQFTRAYLYGQRLIGQLHDGEFQTYHLDAAGNPRMITNSVAEIGMRLRFDALGNSIASNNASPESLMFAGEQFDAGTGLYYLRSRYLDPSIGAFISADSTPANKYLPLSSNTYLYAMGNSQTYQDPSGQSTLSSILVSNMIIGTVVGTLNLVYTRDIKQAAMAAATAAGTGIALTGLLYAMPLAFGAATQFAFGLLPKAKQIVTATGVLAEITGALSTTQMATILTAYEASGTLAVAAVRLGGPVAETLLELRTMVRAVDPKLWVAVKDLALTTGNSLKLTPSEVRILRAFLDLLG